MTATKPKRSAEIKRDLEVVRVFARTGRLPIQSATKEWIAPGLPPKTIPGIVLVFENGECVLDPVTQQREIVALREWLAEGTDPRIVELGVQVVNNAKLLAPPFPKWDVTNEAKIPELVETMGLDVERCLKYELAREKPRVKLVKALEVKLDTSTDEVAVDDEPVLD
jgi:hypothetical protein